MQTASDSQTDQHIVLIHGAGAKPAAQDLSTLWVDALREGLIRDAEDKLPAFNAADIQMVYYADQLSQFAEAGFDPALDMANRRQNLEELATRRKAKDFRRKHYEALPGKTPLKEFAMDLSASLGLGGAANKMVMPELSHYWQDADGWASKLRGELTERLHELTAADSNVLIISHGLGCVLAWDALWSLTQRIKREGQPLKRITRWITIGSPLSARDVQKRLLGHDQAADNRFPTVLNAWHNIAAEDDYLCHDKTVADDFSTMLRQKLIGDIRDHTIYNLSVRYGRSNPHSSVGYLIHPRMAQLLADWLN